MGKGSNSFKKYFQGSKRDIKGLMALNLLTFIFLVTPLFFGFIFHQDPNKIEVASYNDQVSKNIVSSQIKPKKKTVYKKKKKRSPLVIDINKAKEAELVKIKGIGPKRASTLIKFRNKLGGFINKKQMEEVYGLPKEVIQELQTHIKISTGNIKLININTDSFKRILKHPYISYEQTKLIMNLRRKNHISSMSTLVDSKIFTAVEIKKIQPYLNYQFIE